MSRRRNRPLRSLQIENLETRQLMAADLAGQAAAQELIAGPTVDVRTYSPPIRATVGTAAAVADDAYENNDSLQAAKHLGTLTNNVRIADLRLLDQADWYSFQMTAAGTTSHSVGIRFKHAEGDLDLKLFNARGQELRSSTGVVDNETVSLNGLAAGTYYVQVLGKAGPKGSFTQNANYQLTVNPAIPVPKAELFGWWNFATNAANWGGVITMDSQVYNSGQVASGAFNVSWYLSKDAVGSSDDILLNRVSSNAFKTHAAITGGTTYAHPSIAAGAHGSRFNVELQLPALPAGFTGDTFHIIMKTDASGQVVENNELNNFGQIGQNYDRDQINITTPSNLFSNFNVWDASMDDSVNTAVKDGALRVNYNYAGAHSQLSSIKLEAIGVGSNPIVLGSFGTYANGTNKLINLNGIAGLQAGDYQLRLKATLLNGSTLYSQIDAMSLNDTWTNSGTFAGENIHYNGWTDTTVVMRGQGGTDTLVLNATRQEVLSFNGFATFVGAITTNQAIYKGSAYDYLRLTGDREIYFQGFERIRFSDGSIQELAVHPNDPGFADQWNLHVTDVPSAWRFTQGTQNVLLVSLDTGILNAPGANAGLGVHDVNGRLITDATDDDNQVVQPDMNSTSGLGHGHMAISVMAANADTSTGIAGINQGSNVMVADVYNGVTLQAAISNALAFARANGQRVVFQGGIQGEGWINSGGTSTSLASLMSHNADIAVFAIAAGNGGPGGNLTDPNWQQSVSGVAKFETYQANVMSVGALTMTQPSFVGGLFNANNVAMATYSNRGHNLTLVAPTDSPAVDKRGQIHSFGGTSCANPNMAGIASLVWSANPALYGDMVRQVLIDTAYDLGAAGDDNTFGNGLVNADAAVRRAVALARSVDLAGMYWGVGLGNSTPGAQPYSGTNSFQQLPAAPSVAPSTGGALSAAALVDLAFAVDAKGLDNAHSGETAPLADPAGKLANDLAIQKWTKAAEVAKAETFDAADADDAEQDAFDVAFSKFDSKIAFGKLLAA